jgi:hypothetical protein
MAEKVAISISVAVLGLKSPVLGRPREFVFSSARGTSRTVRQPPGLQFPPLRGR